MSAPPKHGGGFRDASHPRSSLGERRHQRLQWWERQLTQRWERESESEFFRGAKGELERTWARGAGTCGARSGRAEEPGSGNRGVRVLFVWPARGSACWIYRVSLSSFLFRLCAFRRCTLNYFRAASVPALISNWSLSSFRYDADYTLSGLQFVRRCPPSPPTPSINGDTDGISHHRLSSGSFLSSLPFSSGNSAFYTDTADTFPPTPFQATAAPGRSQAAALASHRSRRASPPQPFAHASGSSLLLPNSLTQRRPSTAGSGVLAVGCRCMESIRPSTAHGKLATAAAAVDDSSPFLVPPARPVPSVFSFNVGGGYGYEYEYGVATNPRKRTFGFGGVNEPYGAHRDDGDQLRAPASLSWSSATTMPALSSAPPPHPSASLQYFEAGLQSASEKGRRRGTGSARVLRRSSSTTATAASSRSTSPPGSVSTWVSSNSPQATGSASPGMGMGSARAVHAGAEASGGAVAAGVTAGAGGRGDEA
ncbi:hypothetical protein DFH08DRAFT_416343 [Mycena albidolilacea]|uniref:Uncharacterized protein n=1 Tax=Mycena albidolilacea TaxID=1033008 RepID=A0AAD7AIT4_9AGAR|nr:hypothetical protein DFH08DRAFT_416343 [Mycena albidolilacea]